MALGLTQEELAERTDMHWTYLSGIERGIHNVGLNRIVALAVALETSPEEMLAGIVHERPRRVTARTGRPRSAKP